MDAHRIAWIVVVSLAVVPAGCASSSPSPLVMLWCNDYQGWVEEAAAAGGHAKPPAVDQADEYGEAQENWLINDRDGYYASCRAAWEGHTGALPPDSEPLPDTPPNWHVWAEGYSSGQEGDYRWLVVYQGEVWGCDQEGESASNPMDASFTCTLDPTAPFPLPGTY